MIVAVLLAGYGGSSMVGQARPEVTESCLRCGAAMEWRHGTLQCPRCRFKVGCCEGETGDCRPERA